MQMKPNELLQQIAGLINARAKTSETVLMAEIKASEERTKKELKAENKEIKDEIKALRTGVAKKMVEQDERLDNLEKTTGTSSSKH